MSFFLTKIIINSDFFSLRLQLVPHLKPLVKASHFIRHCTLWLFPSDINPPTSCSNISSPGGWVTSGGMWRNYSAAAAWTVMELSLVCLMWRTPPSLHARKWVHICSVYVWACPSPYVSLNECTFKDPPPRWTHLLDLTPSCGLLLSPSHLYFSSL